MRRSARELAAELLLSPMAASAAALLCALHLSPWMLEMEGRRYPWMSANFHDYCRTLTGHGLSDPKLQLLQRSRLAAALPVLLEPRLGVVDALAAGALIGQALLLWAIWAWTRALADRGTAALALSLALMVDPLVMVSRQLSFYPQMAAAFALGSAGLAFAARRPGPWGLLAAGAGAGLCLLIDVRGAIWAGALLGGAALLWMGAPGRLGGLLALALPLELSWWLGRWSYSESSWSLEQQADPRQLLYQRGLLSTGEVPPFALDSHFLWGRSSPLEWPETLRFLMDQGGAALPSGAAMAHELELYAAHVWRWQVLLGLALPLALLALRRHPRRALALLAGAAPFLLAWQGMRVTGEVRVRFLTQILPVLPVVVALGLGGLLGRRLRWGAAALALALALGVGTELLSPWAPWRARWRESEEHVEQIRRKVERRDDRSDSCVEHLLREQRRGRADPLQLQLYARLGLSGPAR